ncbi:hypothetical protein GEMRC1_004175 [Eukaryota sp. GEM-RC1]
MIQSTANWSRRCSSCSFESFPRVDPCIITLIKNQDNTKVLLGQNAKWTLPRFSTIAGYVDAGEVPERAIVREAREEVGAQIEESSIKYIMSQFWPFPRSMMLGFSAVAKDDSISLIDKEMSDAKWFSREELRGMLEPSEDSPHVPGEETIAGQLIRGFMNKEF